MGRQKCDIGVGIRMCEELHRIFPRETNEAICKKLRCDRKNTWAWSNGETPHPVFLQRLHNLGGDALYVLTGQRYVRVKSLTVHGAGGTRRLKWNGESFEEDW